MKWTEFAQTRPTTPRMGQSDYVLVAYYPEPDSDLYITIAFYDKDGVGSGWFERGTFKRLPAPRYWMSLPELPERR